MRLLIISGQTSTGKSTLAKRLSDDLSIALCRKDDYKEEVYFPSLSGRRATLYEWVRSEQLSWQYMYDAVSAAQTAGTDLLIEGNFTSVARRRLRKVLRSSTEVVEIYCFARGFTIYHRYKSRNESGERHPGHGDERWYWVPWLEALTSHIGLRWVHPVRLGERVLKLDMTDFAAVDYDAIKNFVSN